MRARLPMNSIVMWCVAFGSYLLFAGTISFSELLTGVGLATLAVLFAHVVRENSRRRFSAAREQIRPLLRAVGDILPATGRTGAVLAAVVVCGGSPGRSMRSRFRFGLAEDPRQRTRRGLAVLCASLAPNRFVVDVERARGEALTHAVDRSSAEADPEWLQ